jgi:hypothetical protein
LGERVGVRGLMDVKTNIGLLIRPPILYAVVRMEEPFVAFPTGMHIIGLSSRDLGRGRKEFESPPRETVTGAIFL